MSASMAGDGVSLRAPIALSALVHVLAAGAFLLARPASRPPVPPTYRVSLVAAPKGARAVGVVTPTPAAEVPKAAAPVARATIDAGRMKAPPVKSAPVPKAKVATPNATATPAPKTPGAQPVAGGGPTGGRGADVANVKIEGIEFPYPVYLQNVVRQIALQFKPTARGALTAEVSFLIRRDGTIAGLRLTKRSSVYSFDQDALAAVELAGRAFGPLPEGFSDDVLPVIFSFDPRLIR